MSCSDLQRATTENTKPTPAQTKAMKKRYERWLNFENHRPSNDIDPTSLPSLRRFLARCNSYMKTLNDRSKTTPMIYTPKMLKRFEQFYYTAKLTGRFAHLNDLPFDMQAIHNQLAAEEDRRAEDKLKTRIVEDQENPAWALWMEWRMNEHLQEILQQCCIQKSEAEMEQRATVSSMKKTKK